MQTIIGAGKGTNVSSLWICDSGLHFAIFCDVLVIDTM